MDSNQLGNALAVARRTWTSFAMGPSLSMKAGFLFPATKPGALICHSFQKRSLAESVSREQAAPETRQCFSESYWQLCAGEGRKGRARAPHNLTVQLSNFPQRLELGIGALKGISLVAFTWGKKCRPFTHTMRQMSYLLSLERWVAPIFLRTQLVPLTPSLS